MRNLIFRERFTLVATDKEPAGNSYIYCYNGSNPETTSRHVYYGTKTHCAGGNNNGGGNYDHYEYYQKQ